MFVASLSDFNAFDHDSDPNTPDQNVVPTGFVELNPLEPENDPNHLTGLGIKNYRDYLLSRMESGSGLSSLEWHMFPVYKQFWDRSDYSWSDFEGAFFLYEPGTFRSR